MSTRSTRTPPVAAPQSSTTPAAAPQGIDLQPWGNSAEATQVAGLGGLLQGARQAVGGALGAAMETADRVRQGATTAAQTSAEVLRRAAGQGQGDIRREGTFSDPRNRSSVSLPRATKEAKGQGDRLGDWLMERYAFQPSGQRTTDPNDRTLRFFSPGLNTPEPEASRRTQYYADQLGQPMVHLHNGSNSDAKVAGATELDYLTFAATRFQKDRSTPLIDSMTQLLSTALGSADPQDVHAILYSDSTVAGSRAIARVRQQLLDRQRKSGATPEAAEAHVQQLLDRHLFVEMHGNVTDDLPRGPRYVMWSDQQDDLTRKQLPGGSTLGLTGQQRDKDANALYVDYDGAYGGADAHNLAANGVHAVRATWAANGVSSSQELFEKAKSNGGAFTTPTQIPGDAKRLWNPRNDPNFGKKKK